MRTNPNVFVVPGVPTCPGDLQTLKSAFGPDADVHILSPPGYGGSPSRLGGFPERADSLRAAIREYPAEGRWIVGFSGGAYDAVSVVLGGEPVDGLILLAAALGPASDEERMQFRALADLVERGEFGPSDLAPIMLTANGLKTPELAERAGAWMVAAPREVIAAELRSYAEQRVLDDRIGELAGLTTFVHCVGDASIPIERIRAVALRSGARLIEVPGLGHGAVLEDPVALTGAVRAAWSGA